MSILPENFYHIYNQGNNEQVIFRDKLDGFYFLELVKEFALPKCEILAYCLMSNHYHFLVYSNEKSAIKFRLGSLEVTELGNAFRIISSKYSQFFNKKYSQTGSLLRQKTKMKLVEIDNDYPFICFNYIHQNPLKANLVSKMEDWVFSSFKDYCGFRKGTLVNQVLAREILDINPDTFYNLSYQYSDFDLSKIFDEDLII